MAYEPTVWTNREVEKPRTYVMTDNGDGTITLTPSEGTVFATGTPVDATNMNKIETAIDTLDTSLETTNSNHTDLLNRIQVGQKSSAGDGTPDINVTVTFPKAFSVTPSVVAIASIGSLNVSVNTVSTTNFTCTVAHVDGGNWSSNIQIRWIAISAS